MVVAVQDGRLRSLVSYPIGGVFPSPLSIRYLRTWSLRLGFVVLPLGIWWAEAALESSKMHIAVMTIIRPPELLSTKLFFDVNMNLLIGNSWSAPTFLRWGTRVAASRGCIYRTYDAHRSPKGAEAQAAQLETSKQPNHNLLQLLVCFFAPVFIVVVLIWLIIMKFFFVPLTPLHFLEGFW